MLIFFVLLGRIDSEATFTLCVQFSQFTTKLDDGSILDMPRKYSEWVVDSRSYNMSVLQKDLSAVVNWGSGQEVVVSVYNMGTAGEEKLVEDSDLFLAFCDKKKIRSCICLLMLRIKEHSSVLTLVSLKWYLVMLLQKVVVHIPTTVP
jgi:hypothetical protein